MTKGIKRLIYIVLVNIEREIHNTAAAGGLYARGLSSEGYNGGYRDALNDVLLALNGGIPRRNYWWTRRKKL